MIKEYLVECEEAVTEKLYMKCICIDLLTIVIVRESVDTEGNAVIELENGTTYLLQEAYETVLKDWENARGIKIVRMVSI